jgi:hypothetical protein
MADHRPYRVRARIARQQFLSKVATCAGPRNGQTEAQNLILPKRMAGKSGVNKTGAPRSYLQRGVKNSALASMLKTTPLNARRLLAKDSQNCRLPE